MNSGYSMILATCPTMDEARKIAKILVEGKLAACVQILPIESVYIWEGEICESGELLLLIKSKAVLFEAIKAAVLAEHSYQVPQIIQLPITEGLPEYLGWIDENCQ